MNIFHKTKIKTQAKNSEFQESILTTLFAFQGKLHTRFGGLSRLQFERLVPTGQQFALEGSKGHSYRRAFPPLFRAIFQSSIFSCSFFSKVREI